MRTGWRLGIVLTLFGAGAAVLYLAPPVKAALSPSLLFALPMTLGTWSGADGAPEDILPADPGEKLSERRTYRNGDRVAWVSVSLFVGQDEAARRGSINRIYPQHNVSLIETVPFAARLGGTATGLTTLPAVVVHQGAEPLFVAYWHQIGNDVYGSEYRFRLALMRDLIFSRRADTLLIRIATSTGRGRPGPDDLAVVSDLASSVHAALRQETGQ